MGSYWKNKYLQKKWVSLKKSLRLTSLQRSVLIGSLLGDGTLRLGARAINVNLKLEQGLVQKEYLWWKYRIFENWVLTGPKLSYRYNENGEKYLKSWWFRTVRHPILNRYWKMFYQDGKKIVPASIKRYINPLVLAIWIMDDGSYSKKIISISTYAFTLDNIFKLQVALKEKFNLTTKTYRDRDKGYKLYFSVSATKDLVKIIKPWIILSMSYKIGSSN